MNRLRLQVVEEPGHGESGSFLTVRIFIDDHDLFDLIEAEELRIVSLGGDDVAGMFQGIHPRAMFAPSRRLLGVAEAEEYPCDEGDRISLYGCECGLVDCWPISAKIKVGDTTVRWIEFHHPRQLWGAAAGPWSDFSVGPFEFDRTQYEAELAQEWKSGPWPRFNRGEVRRAAEIEATRLERFERRRIHGKAAGLRPLDEWSPESSTGP